MAFPTSGNFFEIRGRGGTRANVVAVPQQPQVIPGSLNKGAVGTAFLGPSPDGSCRAVFSVVTADGAIVQEHTAKGLDGLAPAGTIQPLLGRSWDPPNQGVEPRLGVLMNPYTATPGAAWQLFVSEPFNNTIAVVNLVVFGTAPNQVFGLGSVSRINSRSLNLPVDLAPVQRDADSIDWAANTTLDAGSDFYVANRGDNRRSGPPRRDEGATAATAQRRSGGEAGCARTWRSASRKWLEECVERAHPGGAAWISHGQIGLLG